MKKVLTIIAVLVAAVGLLSLGYFIKPVLKIFQKPSLLLRVNDVAITDLDLKREMLFLKVNENTPVSDITREDILDRLINDVLILAEARAHKLAVSDAAVNQYLSTFWTGYDPKASKRILREHQLSESEWRELVRKRLLIEMTIKQLIEDQVIIGPEELDEYYWNHLQEFERQPRVWARQIVVETQAQAEALKTRLDKGEDFQTLAKKYSRGPEREEGGDLGWVTMTDVPQSFSRALFKMSPGEISAPVTTEYGYHIFRVEKRESGGKVPLEEAKAKIAQDLKMAKTDMVFKTWLENLRSRAKIIREDQRGAE